MKIKVIAFTMLSCIVIGLASCGSAKSSVGYKEAYRYFVRNDIKDYSSRLLLSDEELSRYFGTAAVMGKNGMPTVIDFTKYNVAAIIEPETNLDTEIKVVSIKKETNKVVLRYKVIQTGSPRTYSTVPCLLLQIDKKYGSNVDFVKE